MIMLNTTFDRYIHTHKILNLHISVRKIKPGSVVVFFTFFFSHFFYRSSSTFTSLVFHLDPVEPLRHLLCKGPPNVYFFVSGSCEIQTHVLLIRMRTLYRYFILTPLCVQRMCIIVTTFIHFSLNAFANIANSMASTNS